MNETLSDPTLGSSEPDRCWTLANASEACPLVMTPLCWTLWRRASELGTRGSLYDFGLLPRSAIRLSQDPNELIAACFRGRLAMNVDKLRQLLGAVPGASADDFERDLVGRVRPDAPVVRSSFRRVPFMAARTPVAMLRQGPRLRAMHAEQLAWWQREVLDPRELAEPRALLAQADRRFQRSFRLHLYARGNLLTAVQTQLTRLASSIGRSDLVPALIGGVGGVNETRLTGDLWDVARGLRSRAEFLRTHGFHGPSEGSPVARSWRENSAQLDQLLEAYADRPSDADPRTRERATRLAREEATRVLLARLPGSRRPLARLLLNMMATQIRHLEMGKSTFVMAIDGARRAVRAIGLDLVTRGLTDDPEDAFYLTFDELLTTVPAHVADLVRHRRRCREQHIAVELPTTWTGMPAPTTRSAEIPRSSGTDVLAGVAGGGGISEGVVRVVRDPETDAFAADEVLVCRYTDPGWAPLFALASAVVIDVGGVASHGAVVARELGVPCVIGTSCGTQVLRDGQRVRVNGTVGTVTPLGGPGRAEGT